MVGALIQIAAIGLSILDGYTVSVTLVVLLERT